jgi:hypothetical protein
MQVRIIFSVLLAAFFCSCSSEHFTIGRGDVGQFIMQQAIIRGGSPVTTNGLPSLTTKWRYSTDVYGVVIRMPREEYPSVEGFLLQAFGKPGFGPEDTSDGGRLGEYRLTAKGGGIQFMSGTNWTQVIVIRPITEHELDTEIMPKVLKVLSESQ